MIKIHFKFTFLVEDFSSANSFWMLTFVIISVCIISATILTALICTRQRLRKAANAQLRARGPAAKGAMKRITLNGAVVERCFLRTFIDSKAKFHSNNGYFHGQINGSPISPKFNFYTLLPL